MWQLLESLRIIRAANCLLAAVGVWIGAYLTALTPTYYGPVVAGLAAFFVCAAGNIVNDLRDIESDRINHPDRVLVRGGLSVRYARNLAIGLNVIAVLMGLAVTWQLAVMAAVTVGLLLLYNVSLKRVPLAGNALVALLAGLTFITGGLAVDPVLTFRLPGPLIPAVYAFFFHLVREIIKDVEDMEGDRRLGVTTLPQIIGVSKSLLIALALFAALVLLTLVPIAESWFGRLYQVLTVYVVDLPLVASLILLWGYPTPRLLRIVSVALKIGMAVGLVALLDL